jgi:hypothetical protein
LERRSSIKIVRFVPLNDLSVREGRVAETGREVFRRLLPFIRE